MNRMDADALYDRQQDGRAQQDAAGVVHQHADDDHKDIDHQKNQILIVRNAQQSLCNLSGHVLHRQQLAEDHDHEEHHHNNTSGTGGFRQCLMQAVPLQALIDEHAAGDGIGHADGGGLGSRHDTAIDSAQDDNRHNQSGDGA